MKKLFVSLPMRGLNEREIRKRMNYLKYLVELELGEEVILIDTFIKDEPDSEEINDIGLYFLNDYIDKLKEAECTKEEIKEVERIKEKLNDMWKLHVRIE